MFKKILSKIWQVYSESAKNIYTGTFSLENNGIMFNTVNAWLMFWVGFSCITIEGLISPEPISYGQLPILAGAIVIVAGIFGSQFQVGRTLNRRMDKANLTNPNSTNTDVANTP